MQFFLEGMREVARKLTRFKNRIVLTFENRRLKKSEIQLGLLGWQQAEYFTPEIQTQVQQLMHFEKAQADLVNACAELMAEINGLQTEREIHRRELAKSIAQIEMDAKPIAGQHNALHNQISTKERAVGNFEKAIAELEREDRDCAAILKNLASAEHESIEMRSEKLRTDDRRLAIQDEIFGLRRARERSLQEAHACEQALTPIEARLSEFENKVSAAESEFKERDRNICSQIAAIEREKIKAEKKVEELDLEKTDPYLRIGQCLADSNIAPMNQPISLIRVKKHRMKIAKLVEQLDASAEKSAKCDPRQTWLFYVVITILLVAAGIALIKVIRSF